MKLYSIQKGTRGWMITHSTDSPVGSTESWTTRKNLEYTECITDPIRNHNNPGDPNIPEYLKRYAEKGYAVYGGVTGGDPTAMYILAVPYDSVHVS